MSHYLVDQIAATPNIEVVPETEVLEVKGTDRLEGLVARTGDGPPREIAAAAVFVFIGARPRTEFCDGVLARDPGGFIMTGLDLVRDGQGPPGWPPGRLPALLETSVPGSSRPAMSATARRSASPPPSARARWRSSSFTNI